MADRTLNRGLSTQGKVHVDFGLTVLPQGTGTPTGPLLGEGDAAGAYFSIVRGASGVAGATGVTGCYILTTKNPFVALVEAQISFSFNSLQSGAWTAEFGPITKNANNTLQIPFTTYKSGTATDVPVADSAGFAGQVNKIFLTLRLRNSNATP